MDSQNKKFKKYLFLFVLTLFFLFPHSHFLLAVNINDGPNHQILERDLSLGMKGDDVKLLQSWLTQDKSIYPEGLITGYFGSLTQKAIERYQIANGIVKSGNPFSTGFGRVGPITRASLNSRFTNGIYGVKWGDGKEEKAIFLEGGFLEISSDPSLNFENGSDFTIDVWIKPERLTHRKQIIVGKGLIGGKWNYGIGIQDKGKIFARHLEGDIVTDKRYIKEGEWQHIAVVFKKGKNLFYYNGKLVEEKSDMGFNEIPNDTSFLIGISKEKETGNLMESFLGGIDDLKIYKSSFENKGEVVLDLGFNEGKGIEVKDPERNFKARWNLPLAEDFLSKKLEEIKVEGERKKNEEEEEEGKEEEGKEEKKFEKPSVDLKINGSDDEITIPFASSIKLSWTSQNATHCLASGGWLGEKNKKGSQDIKTLTESANFILTCFGPGGESKDSVKVNVLPSNYNFLPYYGPSPFCDDQYINGSVTYSGGSKTQPKIGQITVDPQGVHYGCEQQVTVAVSDSNGNSIASVIGEAITDNKTTNFTLSLIEGTDTNGTWQGSWVLLDSVCEKYQLRIQAESASGTSSVTLTFR